MNNYLLSFDVFNFFFFNLKIGGTINSFVADLIKSKLTIWCEISESLYKMEININFKMFIAMLLYFKIDLIHFDDHLLLKI